MWNHNHKSMCMVLHGKWYPARGFLIGGTRSQDAGWRLCWGQVYCTSCDNPGTGGRSLYLSIAPDGRWLQSSQRFWRGDCGLLMAHVSTTVRWAGQVGIKRKVGKIYSLTLGHLQSSLILMTRTNGYFYLAESLESLSAFCCCTFAHKDNLSCTGDGCHEE